MKYNNTSYISGNNIFLEAEQEDSDEGSSIEDDVYRSVDAFSSSNEDIDETIEQQELPQFADEPDMLMQINSGEEKL